MRDEKWKPVPGFEKYYEVSNKGRIRSLDRRDSQGRLIKGRIRKLRTGRYGYLHTSFHIDGEDFYFTVHRVVALAFIPCPGDPDNFEINHLDGDKTNNEASNLEWCTHAENMGHAAKNGFLATVGSPKEHMARIRELLPKGSEHPRAKLDEEKVYEARCRYSEGDVKQSELASEYGVSESVMAKAINGDTWAHVPFPGGEAA